MNKTKRTLLLLCLFCTALTIQAQQIIQIKKSLENFNEINSLKHQIRKFKQILSFENITKDKNLINDSLIDAQILYDSITNLQERIYVYGFGSSDAVSLNSVTANGGFSFSARLHTWDFISLSVGIGGNVVKKEKEDSVNIESIFFPDNASSIINAHYEFSFRDIYHEYMKINKNININTYDDFLIFCEGSLQNRNIEAKDSTIHNFGIYNWSAGIKYRWNYEKNDSKFRFDAGIGYGNVSIAPQSKENFETIITPSTTTKPASTIFRGINFLISINYNDLIIYARLFDPLSVNNATTYKDHIFFSTGIKVTGKFFSF
jgi:hypothetical protein